MTHHAPASIPNRTAPVASPASGSSVLATAHTGDATGADSLARAIVSGRVEAWFQPEVDLTTGRTVAYEALARWHHPRRGVLPAGAFIDLAAHEGTVGTVSEIVTADAVRAAVAWAPAGIRTWVNVSPGQLGDDRFVDRLHTRCRAVGLPPHALGIEITERGHLDDLDGTIRRLGALRDLGVGIALDDFGTGHSSLVRLRRLPVDVIKLDRRFVAGVTVDPADRAVVETLIILADRLGLDVVAEGVEDAATAHLLRRLGCRRAQGWLWSPALAPLEARRVAGRRWRTGAEGPLRSEI